MKINRREFLKAGSAVSVAAGHPLVLSLAGLNEAAAQLSPVVTDYKAIVCVFMNGGNDYANTLVPYDGVWTGTEWTGSYGSYLKQREQFAYARNEFKIGSGLI